MKRFKQNMGMLFIGMALGAALTGGAFAAGIVAEPSWSPIYVDGQQVQMTAYNIAGNNFVKLRDIGQAVGFNVYYQNGVQVDSNAPYTGSAPVQTAQAVQTPQSPAAASLRVSSYKGNTLKAGDRSMLTVSPSDGTLSVSSSDPAVADVEQVSGQWVIAAKTSGAVTILVTNSAGESGSLTLAVEAAEPVQVDLNANMEIRQEMIRLINQIRRANGVGELVVNDALMNAAQDCSTKMLRDHDTLYECKTAIDYGWPHGFGDNLTWFSGSEYMKDVARTAVNNWINSPGHFQTMITGRYQTLGVGVTIQNGQACCYMFAGDPNSINAYA